MTRFLRIGCGVFWLSACWSCGTSQQISGDWSGRVAPAHFDYLELRLTQTGTTIRGVACYEVLPDSTAGGVAFRNAAVAGTYPMITVDAPRYNGWTFTGQFQDDGTLRGQWRNAFTDYYPMYAARGLPGGGSGCLSQ